MKILFLNHKQKQCGVYQYGVRTFDILRKSKRYEFVYEEVEDGIEFLNLAIHMNPYAVIYNYHNLTMAWLGKQHLIKGIGHLGIHHEGSLPTHIGFDCFLDINSTFPEKNNHYALPRPLFEGINTEKTPNEHPIISSFGFGFGHKGFGSVVRLVNDQFDTATIRLHIPRAYYGDRNGEATAGVIPGCYNEMTNPSVKLEITHDFLSDSELLSFLGDSDINVFLYHETGNSGLSSVIDYVLSVPVPIAVNTTSMFRHIAIPEICVENKTLPQIIEQGSGILDVFRDMWSNENLIAKYEQIIDRVCQS